MVVFIMDNGYLNRKKFKFSQKKKRLILIFKLSIIILLLSLIVFLFGYDKPMFDKQKLIEFSGGIIAILTIVIIISLIKYKIPKYIPTCNKCGYLIKKYQY